MVVLKAKLQKNRVMSNWGRKFNYTVCQELPQLYHIPRRIQCANATTMCYHNSTIPEESKKKDGLCV